MIIDFLAKIGSVVSGVLLAGAMAFGYTPPEATPTFSASLPQGIAVFETSLQSAITSSATSMTIVSNSVRGGGTLSGYQCFTIDEGSAQAEFVCGTVSGTSVTSLTRGVDPITATTTNATLQFSHRRGASVKITDFPLIQIARNQLHGSESISGILFYNQNNTFSSSTQLVSKKYVDDVANQGAATSTESNGGIVELGTLAEQADSNDGGVDSPRVLQTKYSTSTCQVVGSYNIVASSTTGRLDKNCFDLTANYNFTGVNSLASTTLTATTSISASSVTNGSLKLNGIDYAFPSTRGANSSVLSENGSGSLTWSVLPIQILELDNTLNQTQNTSTTTLKTVVIPASSLTTSSKLQIDAVSRYFWDNSSSNSCIDIQFGDGTATSTLMTRCGTTERLTTEIGIFASSTSAQLSTTRYYVNSTTLNGTLSQLGQTVFSPYTTTNQLYLSFRAVLGGGGNAGQSGWESIKVELLTE